MSVSVKRIFALPNEQQVRVNQLNERRAELLKQSAALIDEASQVWSEMSNELAQALAKEPGYNPGDVVYNPDLNVKAIVMDNGEWFVLPELTDPRWGDEENTIYLS